MSELAEWDSFYVIVGSAAGALIGLQFVVITLIANRPYLRVPEAGAASATPPIVHFATVLLLSVLLRAPSHAVAPPAALWGLIGACGVWYAAVVTRRMRVQSTYRPEFEDWLFYAVLPCVAYAMLVLTAVVALDHAREALFGVGAAVLLLLFVAIHNCWDSVTYHVFVNLPKEEAAPRGRNPLAICARSSAPPRRSMCKGRAIPRTWSE
jgi:hypothetical protein